MTVLALVAMGCGAQPNPRGAPFAAASFADFRRVELASGSSVSGDSVDILEVQPEQTFRLEVPGMATLKVGELVSNGATRAETWHDEPVKAGTIVVRAGVTTTQLLFVKGAVQYAWAADPFEPGYYWFDHENRVLDWSDGALPAPFPEVASPNRLDMDGFAKLDAALARAVKKGASKDAAAAIRRIAGLRAVRALRPVHGFPYATDQLVKVNGKGATWTVEERELRRVSPGEPAEIAVEGPGTLHVWARAQRDNVDEVAELLVLEGTKERGLGGGTVLRKRMTTYDDPGAESQGAASSLRRAIVHVPPGSHTYAVQSRYGSTFIFGILTNTIEHIETVISRSKSESKLIPRAKAACGGSGGDAPCAFAKALAGEDSDPKFDETLGKLDDDDKVVVAMLSKGGPRDPIANLELRASAGDPESLQQIAVALAKDIDENVRGAYERSVARGTTWTITEPEGPAWTVAKLDVKEPGKDGGKDGPTCNTKPEFADLAENEVPVATSVSHEKHVVSLVVEAACDDKRPITLAVDGTTIKFSPLRPSGILHIAVAGETAKVRVVDAAGAKVRAVLGATQPGCEIDVVSVRAPHVTSTSPVLVFDKEHAPGVEVWLKDGEAKGAIDVFKDGVKDGVMKTTHIVVGKPKGGLTALDPAGGRWIRSARVLLPDWAGEGSVKVTGSDKIAVRAIGREARVVGTPEQQAAKQAGPEPLSEPLLTEASRAILAAKSNEEKSAAYMARALMLAKGGAERAALEDAAAAEALGVANAVQTVKAQIKRKPIAAGRTVKNAFGVEPDFDPGAVRCTPSADSPRVKLAAMEQELTEKGRVAYDSEFALRAAELASQIPDDVRAEHLLARAMVRGRWKSRRDAEGGQRVPRPDEKGKAGVLDADMELRPRILAGAPFGQEDFASISADRPGKINLGHSGAVNAHVEFACVARAPAEVKGPCPFEVGIPGKQTLKSTVGADGKGMIDVPQLGKGAIELRMGQDDAKWIAIARVSFDQKLPGTKEIEGRFVLEVPHVSYRYLVRAGQTISAKFKNPALVRVDAALEADDSSATLVVLADGAELALAPGESKVVAVRNGLVQVKGKTGQSTVQISERVPLESGDGDEAKTEAKTAKNAPKLASVELDAGEGTYRDTVLKSPLPLSPLESNLGTLAIEEAYQFGNQREGLNPPRDLDSYLASIIELRRRIESINLTGTLGGVVRLRGGSPTEGGYIILYEDEGHTRLRVTSTTLLFTQRIQNDQIFSLRPRGFIEYSARLGQEFFILPRLGFDGYYTNGPVKIPSSVNVDEDVFNEYRRSRQSMGFLQLLVWWVPSFNSIAYLRGRGAFDITNGLFNHVSARPGLLTVFGDLEVDAFFDASFYPKNRLDTQTTPTSIGSSIFYTGWAVPGNIALVPLLDLNIRTDTGTYAAAAGLRVLSSFRRGLRDFTSLELSFPEQTSGGIPWRGESR